MYRVGPYLTWCNDDGFFLDASATYGYHDNDVNRNVLYNEYQYTSHGGFDAHDSSVYLAAGRDFCYGNLLVTPTVSLQHIYYGQADFTETDAAGANLRLSHYDTHSLRSMVGLRAARTIAWRCRCIMPEVFAGWAHEYLANESLESEFIGGVPFRTSPGDVLRDSGYFGGGLTVMLSRGGYLFSRYRGEMFSDSDFHACDIGLMLQY
jgi:outer membrane autotransporter protein